MSLVIVGGNVVEIDRFIPKKKLPDVLYKKYKNQYKDQPTVKTDLAIRLNPTDASRVCRGPFISADGKIDPLTALHGYFSDSLYQVKGKRYKALEKPVPEIKRKILIKLPPELLNRDLCGDYMAERFGAKFFLYKISPVSMV